MRFILVILACVFATYSVNSEAGDGSKSARELFQQGVKEFNDGEYDNAASSFEEAYGKKVSWKLLFNIAQAQAAAKRYGMALDYFEAKSWGAGLK